MPLFTDVHEGPPAGTAAADLARAQRGRPQGPGGTWRLGAPLNISARHIAGFTRLASPVTGP